MTTYTTGQGNFTEDPDRGNVPVPETPRTPETPTPETLSRYPLADSEPREWALDL